ncbi:synaptonemal complex protein 2-like isoform X3 [Nothobranchius furzeri]|uniref:synaptonemal complex protein 2-like isoform X3 n=1 Tax=Nothobranchius furzeri TaxID=105023 RepID=UPI003904779F
MTPPDSSITFTSVEYVEEWASSRREEQLKMDNSLLHRDPSGLVSVLRSEGLSDSVVIRLHHLVTKELCCCRFSRVLVVIKALAVLVENKDDLQVLISAGLTAKMMRWFETLCNFLTSDLQRGSATLFTLVEEFFDYFLLLGRASIPGYQLSVVLVQLAHFTLQTEFLFPLRLEAIRTFNSILESQDQNQRKLIQTDENLINILSRVAAAILTVGDYELQVSLSEAVCRLTPRRDREQRANHWFPTSDISSAFCDIRDADFEVDCRRFLNFINCYQGDERRVYTFPCLRALLGSTQLLPPKDEKLDEFWIDFNLGSGCVSFFVDDPQGFLWVSIHVPKEEVECSSIQLTADGCTGAEAVLQLTTANPIMHHNIRGQTLELSFKGEYHRELEEAVGRVLNRGLNSPCRSGTRGPVQSSVLHVGQTYSRVKPSSKSQLKILPLSSPSSEEDSSRPKLSAKSQAEVLFDEILHSTPEINYVSSLPSGSSHDGVAENPFFDVNQPASEISEGAEPETQDDHSVEMAAGQNSSFKQDVLRKRHAADSGYLSDHSEGVSVHKRKAESQQDSVSAITTDCLPEEAEPVPAKSHDGHGVWTSYQEQLMSDRGAEPESLLSDDITATFKSFKAQLENHFTGCWQKVETEVLLSLKESQQQVSSLLTAVHQQRLLLLQQLESNITEKLKQLEESSTNLSSINSQILSFFQSEMSQIRSFCEEHMEKSVWLDHRTRHDVVKFCFRPGYHVFRLY